MVVLLFESLFLLNGVYQNGLKSESKIHSSGYGTGSYPRRIMYFANIRREYGTCVSGIFFFCDYVALSIVIVKSIGFSG